MDAAFNLGLHGRRAGSRSGQHCYDGTDEIFTKVAISAALLPEDAQLATHIRL